MTLDLDRIKEYFSTQPIEKAWLFGSFARGEETPTSDVDILVVFDKDSKVGLFKHADIILTLESMLKRSVDLVTEGALLSWIKPNVDEDKILIYERGN